MRQARFVPLRPVCQEIVALKKLTVHEIFLLQRLTHDVGNGRPQQTVTKSSIRNRQHKEVRTQHRNISNSDELSDNIYAQNVF